MATMTPLGAVAPNTVVKTISVGEGPSKLAITPNGRYVYVANSSSASSNNVTVLDVGSQSVLTSISDPSFNGPYSATIDPPGTYAYFGNDGTAGTTLSVVSIATNQVSSVITGFDGPDAMVITPDNGVGFVANYGQNSDGTTVSYFNIGATTATDTISVGGAGVAALAMLANGSKIYAGNYNGGIEGTGYISVIDASSKTVSTVISGFFGPYSIAITPSNRYAYVTNFGSVNFTPVGHTVSVVDLSTNSIVDTITVGTMPGGIAITPDGRYAYVANYNDDNNVLEIGTVSIIEIATNKVMSKVITVGNGPGDVAITPNGEFAYVSNYIDNTVSVIALPTAQITAQGSAVRSRFPLQIDLINRLTWTAEGTSLPVRYTIYRDAALTRVAGVVPATCCPEFLDHNREPCATYTYYIVGTNEVGTDTYPAVVTVRQN